MPPTTSPKSPPQAVLAILEFRGAVRGAYGMFPYICFSIIAHNPGITCSEIAAIVDAHGRVGKLNQIIDVLEDDEKLIRSETDVEDERKKHLVLTPKGEKLALKLRNIL